MNIHRVPQVSTHRVPSPKTGASAGLSAGASADFSNILNSALEATGTDSSIEKLKAIEQGEKKDDEELREATREFESYFVNMLLKQVRKTLNDGGLTEKSEARKNFESLLDQEYAKLMSEGEGIGLGKAMYEAMKKSYF